MNRTVIAITRFAAGAFLAVVVAGCEAEKSRNPLSPNVAGPIAGVSISPPTPVNPVNAEVLNTGPVRLVFNNGSTNGERPLFYIVELASDAAFANKVFAQSKVTPGSGAQTTIVVDASLTADRTYYWRAKADDGANESAYSTVAKFDVVVPIVIETPGPVSPVSGVLYSSSRPTLVVNNAGVQGRVGRVDYWFEVALDQAFAQTIVGLGVERSGGATTSAPMPELPGSTTALLAGRRDWAQWNRDRLLVAHAELPHARERPRPLAAAKPRTQSSADSRFARLYQRRAR